MLRGDVRALQHLDTRTSAHRGYAATMLELIIAEHLQAATHGELRVVCPASASSQRLSVHHAALGFTMLFAPSARCHRPQRRDHRRGVPRHRLASKRAN